MALLDTIEPPAAPARDYDDTSDEVLRSMPVPPVATPPKKPANKITAEDISAAGPAAGIPVATDKGIVYMTMDEYDKYTAGMKMPEMSQIGPPGGPKGLDYVFGKHIPRPKVDAAGNIILNSQTGPQGQAGEGQPSSLQQTYAQGPITPDLVVQAGLPQAEAADWTSFLNWLVKGEAKRFNELYGGGSFTDYSDHPANLGWSGAVDPKTGKHTTAADLFQDEKDTFNMMKAKYGLKDISPASQVKGNALLANDIYRQATGRSLLADWKAGNTAMIVSALASTWPSLKTGDAGGGGAGGGSVAGAGGDEFAQRWLSGQQAALDHAGQRLEGLLAEIRGGDKSAEERKALLRRAIERSEQLSERFLKMSEKPPEPQTPFEAASAFAPLLIGMLALGGGKKSLSYRPTLASMNALSGALQGLREGNDAAYKRGVDVWSKQTEMARTAFEMQNNIIKDLFEDESLDARERQNRIESELRAAGMETELEKAKAGLWGDLYKLTQDKTKLAADVKEKEAKAKLDFARAAALEHGGGKPGTKEADIVYSLQKAAAELGVPVEELPKETHDRVVDEVNKRWAAAPAAGRAAEGKADVFTDPTKKDAQGNPTVYTMVPGHPETAKTLDGTAYTPKGAQKLATFGQNSSPEAIEAVADMIGNYRIAPPSSYSLGRNPNSIAINQKLKEKYPDYDAAKWYAKVRGEIAFTSGRQSDAIRSFGVSIDHLIVLSDAGQALANGDVAALNHARNLLRTQFGYEGPVDFNAVKSIIGSEVSKAILGGIGALADREELRSTFSDANSPEQLTGVVRILKRLMAGQLKGFQLQAQNIGWTKEQFDQHISEGAKRELAGLTSNDTTPGSWQGNPVVLKDRAEYEALPPGQWYRDSDGQVYQKPAAAGTAVH